MVQLLLVQDLMNSELLAWAGTGSGLWGPGVVKVIQLQNATLTNKNYDNLTIQPQLLTMRRDFPIIYFAFCKEWILVLVDSLPAWWNSLDFIFKMTSCNPLATLQRGSNSNLCLPSGRSALAFKWGATCGTAVVELSEDVGERCARTWWGIIQTMKYQFWK